MRRSSTIATCSASSSTCCARPRRADDQRRGAAGIHEVIDEISEDAKFLLSKEIRHGIMRVAPQCSRKGLGLGRRSSAQASRSGISWDSRWAIQSFSFSLRFFSRVRRNWSTLGFFRQARDRFVEVAVLLAELGDQVDGFAGIVTEPCHVTRIVQIWRRMRALIYRIQGHESRRKTTYSDNKLVKRLQRNVGPRHHRLQHDRRGRPGHGLPVRRQGLLHAAGRPADLQKAGAGALRTAGREPRPEAARLSRRRAAALRWPRRGVPFHQIEQDTYSVVKRVVPEGKTTCGLCSRLRRGALYRFAREHGMTRIALGHHRDDIIETLFLNLFNGGRMKAMPPKLLSDDGRHVVIRPLAYCSEQDIERYAELRQFPLIPCNLCGSQPNLQRQAIKAMLRRWKKQHPGRIENIFPRHRQRLAVAAGRPRTVRFRQPGRAGRNAGGPVATPDRAALRPIPNGTTRRPCGPRGSHGSKEIRQDNRCWPERPACWAPATAARVRRLMPNTPTTRPSSGRW
jgi:hypothetical protein